MSELSYSEDLPGYRFDVYKSQPDFEVVHVKQVHGAIILEDGSFKSEESEADGVLAFNIKRPLAIKTADCLPIVVIGKKGAALLHAGWRGVHQKIVQSSSLDRIEPIFFYIGPHIQARHFEVQKDFKENFPGSHHFSEINGKTHFDLGGEVSDQIIQAFPNAEVQRCSLSTFDDSRFHSFRKDATSERNWNILSIIN